MKLFNKIKENGMISNKKLLLSILLIAQLLLLSLLLYSINIENYILSFFCLISQLLIYFYIFYDKNTFQGIKGKLIAITSTIGAMLYPWLYNYFLGLLYVNYVQITGVRNPLFINSGFLSNSLIIWSTMFLIYISFILAFLSYIIFAIKVIKAIHDKKSFFTKEIYEIIMLILVLISSFSIMSTVSEKYKKPENIDNVIKYFLYEYQYYDNFISEKLYICSNLESLVKNGELIKVYPLFSEDKVSYVIKSNNDYLVGISECKN